MTERSDCTIIRDIWATLAAWLEPVCDRHDDDYSNRRGWWAADFRWARAALLRAVDAVRERKPAMAVGSVVAVLVGLPLLLVGGWTLYYDVDRWVERRLGL